MICNSLPALAAKLLNDYGYEFTSGVVKMKIGTICGGNKKFCDFWNSVFEEEMQTQKGKKIIRPQVPPIEEDD